MANTLDGVSISDLDDVEALGNSDSFIISQGSKESAVSKKTTITTIKNTILTQSSVIQALGTPYKHLSELNDKSPGELESHFIYSSVAKELSGAIESSSGDANAVKVTPINQQIAGVKTFTNNVQRTTVPTQDNDLTNKKYVDDTSREIAIRYSNTSKFSSNFSELSTFLVGDKTAVESVDDDGINILAKTKNSSFIVPIYVEKGCILQIDVLGKSTPAVLLYTGDKTGTVSDVCKRIKSIAVNNASATRNFKFIFQDASEKNITTTWFPVADDEYVCVCASIKRVTSTTQYFAQSSVTASGTWNGWVKKIGADNPKDKKNIWMYLPTSDPTGIIGYNVTPSFDGLEKTGTKNGKTVPIIYIYRKPKASGSDKYRYYKVALKKGQTSDLEFATSTIFNSKTCIYATAYSMLDDDEE